MNDAFAALKQSDRTESAAKQPHMWRIIMKNRITKYAAAVIIIAVVAGVPWLADFGGVAWGEVLKNIEQVQTFSCRLWTSTTAEGSHGPDEAEILVYDSSEYGSRMDTYVDSRVMATTYAPAGENVVLMVIHEAKAYMRMSFNDEQLRQMRERQKNPREFLKLFLSADYVELGAKTIDGIEVEGVEVNSPEVGGGMFESAVGRLWVDVKTELPVLMEVEGVADGGKIQTKMVMDEFRWDQGLEPDVFEPNIPADYTLLSEVTLPDVNEDELINGLRFFARLTDGRYPSSLASVTAMEELRRAWKQKYDRPPTNEEQEKFLSLDIACRFYDQLVEENKNVVYHGDKVTAQDIDAELMQWRISDNEYRVIYGDLRTETVVDKEKLLASALELSGAKIPTGKRGLVMRMLGLNEKDVIRGLGVWLELLDGRYPAALNPEAAIKQADSLLATKYGSKNQLDEERKKELEGKTFDIFFASAFYDKLIREKKDVAYYGEKITVEDSDKVLMRWKISKYKYRVIFGDLSRQIVTAEKLAELEKQLEK
jgi:hypothetical protein